MPDEFVIDEMETEQETPEQKPEDQLPDQWKGKSPQEILDHANKLSDALKISEDARRLAEIRAEQGKQQTPPPEEPKELTREELTELMREDPAAALDYISAQSERKMAQQLQERLGPIATGAISTIESSARTKYPLEFELFADQIEQLKAQVNPQVLANPTTWDQMISYVRGLPENFEKMFEHRVKQSARQTQEGSTGFVGVNSGRSPQLKTGKQLDATALKIAETLGMTPDEYIKWGGGE